MKIHTAIVAIILTTLLFGCVKDEEHQRVIEELRQTKTELGAAQKELDIATRAASNTKDQLDFVEVDFAEASQKITKLEAEVNSLTRSYAAFNEAARKLQSKDLAGALQAYSFFIRDFPSSPQVPTARAKIARIEKILIRHNRTWTSASGAKIVARYLPEKNAAAGWENVALITEDGREIKIARSSLSREDQAWLSALPSALQPQSRPVWLREHEPKANQQIVEKAPPPVAKPLQTRAPKRVSKLSNKPSAKLSDYDDTWTIIKKCRLLTNAFNDGDSFHANADGKEYIFRLYEVDTPESETDSDVAARIADQMAYWGMSENDVLKWGKKATEFTRKELKRSFTVITRFEDALGRSQLPRNYAFILTAEGEDLGQVLVANGMARAYGQKANGGWGNSKSFQTLKKLEAKAKKKKIGMWQ
jgi:endonuclease YncB( thermonuclease family)